MTLDQPALNRLEELRKEYKHAKKHGDVNRIQQILYMAKSIKAGERFFIYDLPKNFGEHPKSDVPLPEPTLDVDLSVAFFT